MLSMFKRNPKKTTVDEYADAFLAAIGSHQFACEANSIMYHGIDMLRAVDKKSAAYQDEIDNIVIGTIVCTMITNDINHKTKYYPYLQVDALKMFSAGTFFGKYGLCELVYPNVTFSSLKEDTSRFNQIYIVSNKVNMRHAPLENVIYLMDEAPYCKCLFISKQGINITKMIPREKFSEFFNKYQFKFGAETRFIESPAIIKEALAIIGEVPVPFYSFIPLTGKLIADKLIPFHPTSVATVFPSLSLAYLRQHFGVTNYQDNNNDEEKTTSHFKPNG